MKSSNLCRIEILLDLSYSKYYLIKFLEHVFPVCMSRQPFFAGRTFFFEDVMQWAKQWTNCRDCWVHRRPMTPLSNMHPHRNTMSQLPVLAAGSDPEPGFRNKLPNPNRPPSLSVDSSFIRSLGILTWASPERSNFREQCSDNPPSFEYPNNNLWLGTGRSRPWFPCLLCTY